MSKDLSLTVELTISCKDLSTKDLLSKSVYLGDVNEGEKTEWKTLGVTEQKKNNHNPNFDKTFIVTYHFEEQQPIKFDLYDIDTANFDGENVNPNEHDFLGCANCLLSDICTKKEGFSTNLNRAKKGSIYVKHRQVHVDGNTESKLFFLGENLPAVDTFGGASDPYYRLTDIESGRRVYESEVLDDCLDPVFYPAKINLQKLCGGNYDRNILFECFDKGSLRDKLMMSSKFTLNEVKSHRKGYSLPLEFGSGVKKRQTCEIKCRYREKRKQTIFDYINEGTEIGMVVAVDFTQSNGDVTNPKSLHYVDPDRSRPNDYEKAIDAIGKIITAYDHSGEYPLYGFGGIFPGKETVDHCKLLDAKCKGVEGIIECYHKAIKEVKLSGPTNLAEIVREVRTKYAQNQWVNGWCQKYTILLVITDGTLDDMDQTKAELIETSKEACSVLLVGVGDEDFRGMKELDSDEGTLTYSSYSAVRDICHFCNFTFLKKRGANILAKKVLEEIPNQVVEFFEMKNKKELDDMEREEIRRIDERRAEIRNRVLREREEIEKLKREQKERDEAEKRAERERIRKEKERIEAEKRAEKERRRAEKNRLKEEKQREREKRKREKESKKMSEKKRKEWMKIPEAIRAAMRKNVSSIKKLLESGKNMNVKDKHGFNALHYACVEKNEEIIRLLLSSKQVESLITCLKYHKYAREIRKLVRKMINDLSPELDGYCIIDSCKEVEIDFFTTIIQTTKVKLSKLIKTRDKEYFIIHYLLEENESQGENALNGFIKFVVNSGKVDLNIKDDEGNTAIFIACEDGNFEIVELLFSKKADIEVVSKRISDFPNETRKRVRKMGLISKKIDRYCLRDCIENDDVEFFSDIISKTPFDLNGKNFTVSSEKMSILGALCKSVKDDKKKEEWLVQLVSKVDGIDLNVPYKNGSVPVMSLATANALKGLNLFFKKKADFSRVLKFAELVPVPVRRHLRQKLKMINKILDSWCIFDSVEGKDYDYFCDLISTTERNLNEGVGYNTKSKPLLFEIVQKKMEDKFVDALLERDVNVNLKSSSGWNVIGLAVKNGSFQTVEKLVAKNASVNILSEKISDFSYETKKFVRDKFFSKKRSKRVDEYCLKDSIDKKDFTFFKKLINEMDKSHLKKLKVEKIYIIHQIVKNSSIEFLKAILQKKVSIDVKDKDSNTPLEVSLVLNKIEMANLLMDSGADVRKVEFENSNNDSILHYYASQPEKTGIVSFVVEKYPKMRNEKNSLKLVPLQVAYRSKALENFKVLLKSNPKMKHKFRVLMRSMNEGNVEYFRIIVSDRTIDFNKKIKFKDQKLNVNFPHYLIEINKPVFFQILLELRKEIDVNTKDKRFGQRTPISVCVFWRRGHEFFESILKANLRITDFENVFLENLLKYLCDTRAENALIELMVVFEKLLANPRGDENECSRIRSFVESHLSHLFKLCSSSDFTSLAALIISLAKRYDKKILGLNSLTDSLANGVGHGNEDLVREIIPLLTPYGLGKFNIDYSFQKAIDVKNISIFRRLLQILEFFQEGPIVAQMNRAIHEKLDDQFVEEYLSGGSVSVDGFLRAAIVVENHGLCMKIMSSQRFFETTDKNDYIFAAEYFIRRNLIELREILLHERCFSNFAKKFDQENWNQLLRVLCANKEIQMIRMVITSFVEDISHDGVTIGLKMCMINDDLEMFQELTRAFVDKNSEEVNTFYLVFSGSCEGQTNDERFFNRFIFPVLKECVLFGSFNIFSKYMGRSAPYQNVEGIDSFGVIANSLINVRAPIEVFSNFVECHKLPFIDELVLQCVEDKFYKMRKVYLSKMMEYFNSKEETVKFHDIGKVLSVLVKKGLVLASRYKDVKMVSYILAILVPKFVKIFCIEDADWRKSMELVSFYFDDVENGVLILENYASCIEQAKVDDSRREKMWGEYAMTANVFLAKLCRYRYFEGFRSLILRKKRFYLDDSIIYLLENQIWSEYDFVFSHLKLKRHFLKENNVFKILDKFLVVLKSFQCPPEIFINRYLDLLYSQPFATKKDVNAWRKGFEYLVGVKKIDLALDVLREILQDDDLVFSKDQLLSFLRGFCFDGLSELYEFVLKNLEKLCMCQELKPDEIFEPIKKFLSQYDERVIDILLESVQMNKLQDTLLVQILNFILEEGNPVFLRKLISAMKERIEKLEKLGEVLKNCATKSQFWALLVFLNSLNISDKILVEVFDWSVKSCFTDLLSFESNHVMMIMLKKITFLERSDCVKYATIACKKKNGLYLFREFVSKGRIRYMDWNTLYNEAFANDQVEIFKLIVSRGGDNSSHLIRHYLNKPADMLEIFITKNRKRLKFTKEMNGQTRTFIERIGVNRFENMIRLIEMNVESVYSANISGMPTKEMLMALIDKYPKVVTNIHQSRMKFFTKMEIEKWRGDVKMMEKQIKSIETTIKIKCSAHGLPKMDSGLGKCDPYFVVTHGRLELGRSKIIKRTYTPDWTEMTLILPHGLTTHHPILFQLWDYDRNSDDDYIGAFEVIFATNENQYQTIRLGGERGTSRGNFCFDKIKITEKEVVIDNPKKKDLENVMRILSRVAT